LSIDGDDNDIKSTVVLDCPIGIDLFDGTMSNTLASVKVSLGDTCYPSGVCGEAGTTCIRVGTGTSSNNVFDSILDDCINPILVLGNSNVFIDIDVKSVFGGIQVEGNSNQFTRVNIEDVINQNEYGNLYLGGGGTIPCDATNSCPTENGFEIKGNMNILSDVTVSKTYSNGVVSPGHRRSYYSHFILAGIWTRRHRKPFGRFSHQVQW
jgi:hypothetical protein